MFLLLRRQQNFLAGIALGLLIFKPQLGLAAAVIFVAIGAWKVAAGAILERGPRTFLRSSLLRSLAFACLVRHAGEREQAVSVARAQALSDPLPANFLDNAVALAWRGVSRRTP